MNLLKKKSEFNKKIARIRTILLLDQWNIYEDRTAKCMVYSKGKLSIHYYPTGFFGYNNTMQFYTNCFKKDLQTPNWIAVDESKMLEYLENN